MILVKDKSCGIKIGDTVVIAVKECTIGSSTMFLGETLKITGIGYTNGSFWLETHQKFVYPSVNPGRLRKSYKNEEKLFNTNSSVSTPR